MSFPLEKASRSPYRQLTDHLTGSLIGFGKRGLLEKGSFQKSPFSRGLPRDSREPPDCGKQRRIRPFSKEFRDSSSEKTPFEMTPFSVPELTGGQESLVAQQSEKCPLSLMNGPLSFKSGLSGPLRLGA